VDGLVLMLLWECQVHERSLTLVSPGDKRQSLTLAYCESALSSSLPKCTAETLKSGGSVVYYDVPGESELEVRLNATDVSECSPSSAGGDDSEGHWVLEDIERALIGKGSHRVVQSTLILSGPAGSAETLHDGCQLRLLERLPSGVFADQFELQGIQRRGGMHLELLAAIFQVVSEPGICYVEYDTGSSLEVLRAVVCRVDLALCL
jgi:hypothetical protein